MKADCVTSFWLFTLYVLEGILTSSVLPTAPVPKKDGGTQKQSSAPDNEGVQRHLI